MSTAKGAYLRKEKRHFRKIGQGDAKYQAYCEGQCAVIGGSHMPKRLQENPYPPGVRHDAYEYGCRVAAAELMGAHHGRNW